MAKPDIAAMKAAAKEKALKTKDAVIRKKAQASMPQYYDMPEQTGNAEIDSTADLDALQSGFRKRAKDESRRFELATDTEHWFCVNFQTREQKDAFLKAMNLWAIGDKYLDGQLVADVLGVALPDADVPYNTSAKIDSAWSEFVD